MNDIRDQLDVILDYHAETCDLGPRTCADCLLQRDSRARSALVTANSERTLIGPWVDRHPFTCVYCGSDAEHRDHLVPLPWTGQATRRFVPTVPACGDCNVRIGDAHVFTIAGRAEVAGASLRKKHEKQLRIADRTPAQIAAFSGRLRVNIKAAQARRQIIRRRLLVLDSAGAPFVPEALLLAA